MALFPSITPKVLQCDGTFATGSVTSHPAPTVRAELQSLTPGLKPDQRRLSILPSATVALWRFDSNFTLSAGACFTGGVCPGGDSCKTYTWNYNDPNGTSSVQVGQCTYRDAAGVACANTMSLQSTDQPVVPLGACPGSTTTLVSGNVAITPLGPLPLPGGGGATASGYSLNALQLNGANYATAPDESAWDLPATYTIAAWVNATAGFTGRIVSQQGATGYWGIGIGAGGLLRHFDSRDAGVGGDLTRGVDIRGAWHLVHVVRRNSIDRRYYVDGVLVGTAPSASTNSFTSHPNNATLEIGRYNSGGAGSEFFTGRIDDVRINTGALSDDDIMLEYNTQYHKFSSNAGVSFSTTTGSYSAAPAYGTPGVVTYIPTDASYGANKRWVFVAQSTYSESTLSTSYGVTIDNSPPIAPTLNAVATSANDITWSWGLPPRVCLPPGSVSVTYQLVDAPGGSTLIPPGTINHPTASVAENLPGAPNQLVGRKLRVTDVWGSGLSDSTSIYTLANPPGAAVVASAVSTASAVITWTQNGNPSYTRYLLAYSQDPTFATGVSTPTQLSDNFTGSSTALNSLSIGTTYYVRVQAFSGRSTDTFGGTGTVFVSTSLTTLPAAPQLGGVPQTNTSILWTWSQVQGAQYYKLFDVNGSTLYTGGALSFLQGGLTTNTQYTTRVEAISMNGAGSRALAATFTKANDPVTTAVTAAYSSSITYSWGGNLNPSYTFYEVAITTDATFAITVTTLTVNAVTATVNDLFPGTTYYARVRSINGNQETGNFVAIPSTRTISDPAITIVLAPPSAYVPPNGSVGQWHFDAGSGTSAIDSSVFGNTAYLTCITASCVSTPTFAAGPTGLGTAASFSGLANGFVRVPDAAQYAFTDKITVSAWVYPDTVSQVAEAGIAVRGNGGVENFALDISTDAIRRFRFLPKPGISVSSTHTITAGTWTHLIGVYDSVAGTATLYVNGRPASTLLGVPARTAAAHDISIGNRQSAAAAYDKGFIGRIDSVRVQARSLTAAEALAEFEGSFVSTITPPSPNNTVLIGLSPNAFGAPATLFVSVDPMVHPISITPAVLNAGLTVIPTGYTLLPNSIVEIVPIVGGTPFTQTLGSSASISMPYADANGDSLIDGTSPPLPVSRIQVYTLNTAINRWEALQTYVDTGSKRVVVFTPHFSVFAMFSLSTVGTSLNAVRVYPVPWKPNSRGKFDAAGITFDRLPASGVVRILNLAGERVREFTFDGASAGSVVWNGYNDSGARVASGVYFARITSSTDGAASLVKFAIER